VPVPSARAARRRRGEDIVATLAARAARRLRSDGQDVDVVSALRHVRRVADSVGLDAAARAANLTAAFAFVSARRRRLEGARVVVVDDLITTGATLAECTLTLGLAGVAVEAVATVAATRRRRL